MSITRKLIFHSEELGEVAEVIFLFDKYDGKPDSPITSHPVVWKKAYFGKTGNHSKTLEYTNQLTFSIPDPGDLKFHFSARTSTPAMAGFLRGSKTIPVVWRDVDPDSPLDVGRTEDGKDFKFSIPNGSGSDPSAGLTLRNQSGEKVDAVLGFREQPGSLPQYARVFRNIGHGQHVSAADFKPILRAYVTSAYKEDLVLLEPISEQPIWSVNLDALAEKTQWKISYEYAKGNFVVTQTA